MAVGMGLYLHSIWYGRTMRPNALPLSCAAILDRESVRADSSFQNGRDLRAAQRRQLQRHVRRQVLLVLMGDQVHFLSRFVAGNLELHARPSPDL